MLRLCLILILCAPLFGQIARNRRDPLAVQASQHLQKVRETNDFVYLDRASALVDRMLTANPDHYEALRLRLEIAMHHHRFPKVVGYAEDLIARNPSDSGVYGLMGDALIELGRYEEAGKAFDRMVELAPGLFSYNRVAWLRFVQGHAQESLQWMAAAVAAGSPVAENVAWCLVEYGDLLFKTGHLKLAEESYRLALVKFPAYHRANGALGRLMAAQGRYADAIAFYRQAQATVPYPEYAAGLEFLLAATGKPTEARQHQKLVDAVEQLMKANGEQANRTLALVYADTGRNLPRALEIARAEFEVRQDVYSYDALSWVLLKNGKVSEAEQASGKAMALNTPEPLFFYHAGCIAEAAGRPEEAVSLWNRALAMNPSFDMRHAPDARKRVARLSVNVPARLGVAMGVNQVRPAQ